MTRQLTCRSAGHLRVIPWCCLWLPNDAKDICTFLCSPLEHKRYGSKNASLLTVGNPISNQSTGNCYTGETDGKNVHGMSVAQSEI